MYLDRQHLKLEGHTSNRLNVRLSDNPRHCHITRVASVELRLNVMVRANRDKDDGSGRTGVKKECTLNSYAPKLSRTAVLTISIEPLLQLTISFQ